MVCVMRSVRTVLVIVDCRCAYGASSLLHTRLARYPLPMAQTPPPTGGPGQEGAVGIRLSNLASEYPKWDPANLSLQYHGGLAPSSPRLTHS
jgi:hypothetical protein